MVLAICDTRIAEADGVWMNSPKMKRLCVSTFWMNINMPTQCGHVELRQPVDHRQCSEIRQGSEKVT